MNDINQNDDIECIICRDKRSVCIPLITCAHSHTFCEECIRKWIAEGYPTCPKCRAILPLQDYLTRTRQNHVNITNVSLILNYHRTLITQNIHSSPPSSSTAGRLMHNIFMYYSIGLLLGLIIYPTIKQL